MIISKLNRVRQVFCDLIPLLLSQLSALTSWRPCFSHTDLCHRFLNVLHFLLTCRSLLIFFPLPQKSFLSLHHLCLNLLCASLSISLDATFQEASSDPRLNYPTHVLTPNSTPHTVLQLSIHLTLSTPTLSSDFR